MGFQHKEQFGINAVNKKEYDVILLENLIASILYNLSNNNDFHKFFTYYDPRKGGVNFLVQKVFEKPIPIEVGLGKKSDRQVRNAILLRFRLWNNHIKSL